eukprot:g7271.t1
MSAHPTTSSDKKDDIGPMEKFVQDLRSHNIRLVIFDLDLTITRKHTSGFLSSQKLNEFHASVSPVFRDLVEVLEQAGGFEVAIATNADDIYYDLLKHYKPGQKFITGFRLVNALLAGIAYQPKALEPIKKICLNHELYKEGDNPIDFKEYYFAKLKSLGVNRDQSNPKSIAAYEYPPPKFKAAHLRILHAMIDNIQMENMLLLDDKLENVHSVVKLGAYGIHVTGKNALHHTHLSSWYYPATSKDPPGKLVPRPSDWSPTMESKEATGQLSATPKGGPRKCASCSFEERDMSSSPECWACGDPFPNDKGLSDKG